MREFIDEGWNRHTEGRKAFDAVLTHTGIARRKNPLDPSSPVEPLITAGRED